MASTTRWVIDTDWTDCGFITTDFNSLASGSCAVSSSITSSWDQYAEVSFSLVLGGTTTATSYLDLYILPLGGASVSYGDGTITGSTLPAFHYRKASSGVKILGSGSSIAGVFPAVVLPPGDYKYAIANQLGIALNASAAASVKHRTFNINLNA